MRNSRFKRWISASVAIIMLVATWVPAASAGTKEEGGEKEYIVRYKTQQGLTMSATSLQTSSISASMVDSHQESVLYKVYAKDEQEFINKMQQDPNVEFVEPNLILKALDLEMKNVHANVAVTLDEPFYQSEDQIELDFLRVPQAWEQATNLDQEVAVAVIDSGIDNYHPDLMFPNGNSVIEDIKDYVDGGEVDDLNGHGTHVAGIIASQLNNKGIAGVAGPATDFYIYDYKVLDAEGKGDSFDIAAAIDHAVSMNVDIINLSLGGEGDSQVIVDAVNNALNAGVLVIAAAGNDGADVANYVPANIPGVLTVGSYSLATGERSSFSNYGDEVEVYAPGEFIYSTISRDIPVTSEVYDSLEYDSNGDPYAAMSGTSMAAPFVTGIATLILAENNTITPTELWNRLTSYTQTHDGLPVINAYNSVAKEMAQTVHFTNPVGLTTVSGDVYVDVALSNLQSGDESFLFTYDGNDLTVVDYVYFDTAMANHSFYWDTTSFADGNYELFVALYDADASYAVSSDIEKNISVVNTPVVPATIGGGGGGGGFLPVEQPIKVTEEGVIEDLQTEKQVVVNISDDDWSAGIDFEVNALHELKNTKQPITINSDKFSIQLDPESLDLSSIDELFSNNKDVVIRLNVDFSSAKKLDLPSNMKAASDVADITLSVLSEGEETLQKITTFNKPVKITFSINSEDELFNVDLLGAYYVDENNGLAYMGGFHSLTTNEYVFETDHFSKFVIAELNKEFSDVSAAHWAHHDIQVMAAHHLVNGVTEDEFQPGAEVTRAQYAAMLTRALGLNQGTKEVSAGNNASFNDISGGEWFANAVQAAETAGIVKGDNEGNFRPNDQITRQEMAVMVSRALAYKGIPSSLTDEQLADKLSSFTDKDRIASWSKESVALAVEHGIINGRTDGSFDPVSNASRAEATVMLKRLWVLVK